MNANSEFSTDRITISRSTLQQALEALERARPLKADYTTLEYFEEAKRKHYAAMAALRAALAQQDEPDWQDLYLKEKQRADMWRDKYESVAGTEQRIHPQAEPVEPVAQFNLNTMPGQADAHLRALLRYTENFYATAIEHGMRAGPTANAIAHVERAGKALHQIVHAQEKMLNPAQPVEPVAPVAVVATQSDVWRGYNGQWAPPGEPTKMAMLLRDLPIGTLLYTAPPQQAVDGGVD